MIQIQQISDALMNLSTSNSYVKIFSDQVVRQIQQNIVDHFIYGIKRSKILSVTSLIYSMADASVSILILKFPNLIFSICKIKNCI